MALKQNSQQQRHGPAEDFSTATRDEHAFRLVRDKYPAFDLETIPNVPEHLRMIWRVRRELDTPSVQEGKRLDECVEEKLRALADVDQIAETALNWLVSPDAPIYNKPSEATKAAQLLVENWQRAPRYEVFTFADMKRMARFRWIVRGFLVECTVSTLSADSGGFKSFLALELALCIATGAPFFGREVTQGPVVYVAAEGFYTILERAQAWSQVRGIELPENFHLLRVPVNVANTGALQEFIATVEGFEPIFVVLDTLSQNALGLNENSNDEMALFMAGMAQLGVQMGAHIMALHHNSKAGGFRGAGAIKANVDTHITLERPENDDTNTVFVRCEKQRGKPFEPFTLRGQEVEIIGVIDEYGDAVTSLVFDPCGDVPPGELKHPSTKKRDATAEKLLQIFDDLAQEWNGTVKTGTWQAEAEKQGVKRSPFYRYLKELAPENGRGPIEKDGGFYKRVASSPSELNGTSGTSGTGINKSPHNQSQQSHHPLGVGLVGLNGGNAENGTKGQRKSGNKPGDSEPYKSERKAQDEAEGDEV